MGQTVKVVNREEWNQRYQAAPRLWTVDPGPFLEAELESIPPGRALDLGAGEGRTALWLARRGWHVTAVDFSDVALERARGLAEHAGLAGQVTWIDADLAEVEMAQSAYDLVLMLFVHLPPDARDTLVRRAVEALAPGGTILVVGYDTANATEGDDGVRDPALVFSTDDIIRQLDGLQVLHAEQRRVGRAFDAIVRAVKVGAG